jgi:hypothetical protein
VTVDFLCTMVLARRAYRLPSYGLPFVAAQCDVELLLLVIGDINPAVLTPVMITTGKAAKVSALQDKGQDIELMTEDDFLRSL